MRTKYFYVERKPKKGGKLPPHSFVLLSYINSINFDSDRYSKSMRLSLDFLYRKCYN